MVLPIRAPGVSLSQKIYRYHWGPSLASKTETEKALHDSLADRYPYFRDDHLHHITK